MTPEDAAAFEKGIVLSDGTVYASASGYSFNGAG